MKEIQTEKMERRRRVSSYKRIAIDKMIMNDECEFCTPLNAWALHHCVSVENTALRRAFDMSDMMAAAHWTPARSAERLPSSERQSR